MKKILSCFALFAVSVAFAQVQTVTYSIAPPAFEETTSITITVNGSSLNETSWGIASDHALYLWSWCFDVNDANSQDCPTNGSWTSSSESNRLTYNAGTDSYSITFVPTTFYNRAGIGKIGFLVKAKNGTGDKKSQDIFAEVGAFGVTLSTPTQNSNTILAPGSSLQVTASNTNGNASYVLLSNGVVLNTNPSTTSYSFNHAGITANQNYELQVTQGAVTISKKFSAIVNPGTVTASVPAGMEDGINYNPGDATRATLVLSAPGKDFVYIAGSFNNWEPDASYAMKKDPDFANNGKFWLEISGLTPNVNYTYQYWVVDTTPFANSPALVKTADPFSTLVVNTYDDPFIPAATYPNIPAYPAGQNRDVTVLQTGQAPYNWQVTNFTKPKKEDLVVYEVLIRDFDANRNFQSLIDRIDYFKNLKINAIELMPVMEFEGNESWGYNTSFHMALDKFYGTSDKFKELIDLCHQNGIAVILDVALNHAFGRNPMVRMWMKDPDGDGWGDASSENPYFNEFAKHSYSVGNDFNHASPYTRAYVKRVIKHWIKDYKIDGFRWDLTKGFTQACSGGDDSCTNTYQADRVAVLKEYADYSWFGDNSANPNAWNGDPYHYAIFEHLGADNEEQQWANYRLNETPSKGVMMWGELTYPYTQLIEGYATGADISRIGNTAHGFTGKRVMGYPESHDKERLMYSAMKYGLNTGTSPVFNNLNNSLARMSSIAAISLLVPGPKMIWHFADLGYDDSIYTCDNGTVNTETDATTGDCKLSTKPQEQWTGNWLGVTERAQLYNNYARMISLKINEPVFEGSYTISPDGGNNLKQRIYVFDNALPATALKNVVILTNFNSISQSVTANFPYAGTWYNLMDNSSVNVINTAMTLNIAAGGFRIYGNKQALLNTDIVEQAHIRLSPNPASGYFTLDAETEAVEVYSITGQLVKSYRDHYTASSVFEVGDLTAGVYIVKSFDANQRETTMKLVKQ
ncbi:alpha-amylase [Flavobacterium magnum]|uniref:Alpha-amylase n=1 Tax=Flavobacterium magnum TaxID=2162713 RepID=A0A2S0RD88_9FLAO|nr:alpha-amylase family glycosyl hydrolase [Flavobacterium magnum]AWA29585.1 alpha-amylase [Flavobacterium magnum]